MYSGMNGGRKDGVDLYGVGDMAKELLWDT
jgi:hypothetical protein